MKHIEVEVAWLAVKSKLDSQQKYDSRTFSKVFRPPVGTNKSPILWVPGYILPCAKPPSPVADLFRLMPR